MIAPSTDTAASLKGFHKQTHHHHHLASTAIPSPLLAEAMQGGRPHLTREKRTRQGRQNSVQQHCCTAFTRATNVCHAHFRAVRTTRNPCAGWWCKQTHTSTRFIVSVAKAVGSCTSTSKGLGAPRCPSAYRETDPKIHKPMSLSFPHPKDAVHRESTPTSPATSSNSTSSTIRLDSLMLYACFIEL